MKKLQDLSNEELLARLHAHVGNGHVWQARLIAYLAEVEDRRLHAEHACPSMWDFCVRKLGMSASEAQRRIAAARVVTRFPLALGFLERGEIHLCALYALRAHLTDENHQELLREATSKTTREVEATIATRFPRPDVMPCIEPVAPQLASTALAGPSGVAPPAACAASLASAIRPKVEPLSATRYRVELTVSASLKSKLERIKDLTRHRNPTGDLETILDLSLGLLLERLEKERLGKTSRPRTPTRAKKRTQPRAPNHPDVRTHEAVACADGEAVAGAVVADGDGEAIAAADGKAVACAAEEAVACAAEEAVACAAGEAVACAAGEAVACADGKAVACADGKAVACADGKAVACADGKAVACADGKAVACADGKAVACASVACADSEARDGAPAVHAHARRGYISREVRRHVFTRDGEQCSYVDADGHRCPARGFLELDHIHPTALGGSDEADNLRVRCATHNHLYAEQVYGRRYVDERIHFRRGKYGRARSPSLGAATPVTFDIAARGLRSLGFRDGEVRRALAILETRLDEQVTVETILRAALLLLT